MYDRREYPELPWGNLKPENVSDEQLADLAAQVSKLQAEYSMIYADRNKRWEQGERMLCSTLANHEELSKAIKKYKPVPPFGVASLFDEFKILVEACRAARQGAATDHGFNSERKTERG